MNEVNLFSRNKYEIAKLVLILMSFLFFRRKKLELKD